MQITARGVLLLSAAALITLKLAGVIAWPWLTVLLPALIYALPFLWLLACVAGAVAVACVLMVGILLEGAAAAALASFQRHDARQRRQDALRDGAVAGPWDRAA